MPRKSYTFEQYWALPDTDDDKLYELVNGKLEEVEPFGQRQGWIANNVHSALGQFVRQHKLGKVYPLVTFRFDHKEGRIPNLAFVAKKHVPAAHSDDPLLTPPELAIEFASDKVTWGKMEDKIATYQQYGVKLIWVVPPRSKIVHVYHLENGLEPQVVGYNAELDGEDVIVGFKLKVSEIFE